MAIPDIDTESADSEVADLYKGTEDLLLGNATENLLNLVLSKHVIVVGGERVPRSRAIGACKR